MKRLTIICILGLLFLQVTAQFSDDFSDGNFTTNPQWFGNTADFIVNDDHQLQLNASSGGKSILCTSLKIADSIRWDIEFNLLFTTSAANKLRVYLLLDTSDLSIANGYYIELGQNGSEDPLHFFSLENGQVFLLGSSTIIFEEEVDLHIAVIRFGNGNWTVYAERMDGAVHEILRLNDSTFGPERNRIFCLQCIYTSTRGDKFFFDRMAMNIYVPDKSPPELINARAIDSVTLELTFNENIDLKTKGQSILIQPGSIRPSVISVFHHKLQIKIEREFNSGTTYTCFTNSIADTAQNESGLQEASFEYIKLSTPYSGEIVINEILFDPSTGDSPFIELLNTSDKYFKFSDIFISITKSSTVPVIPIVGEFILNPKSFVVITNDRTSTITNFPTHNQNAIIETGNFSLPRDFGSVVLRNRNGIIIDSVYFSDGFHHILLDDKRGVALERISPMFPAQNISGWNSASESSGWGTPGLANSHYISLDTVTSEYTLVHKTFSPDGDGHEDFILIRFADSVAGNLATIRVYDEFGRKVSVIMRNELLGNGSAAKWAGTSDDQQNSETGIYILLIEIMNDKGIVSKYKEAVILATRF